MTSYTATYTIYVDWDRSGVGSPEDDITEYVRSFHSFLGFREPYKNVAGEMTLEINLDNSSGRFSPENISSPLYSVRWRNAPVTIMMVVDGGAVTFWRGFVDTIRPEPGINGSKRATLTATGAKRIFDSATIYLPIQIGQNTAATLLKILQSVTVPQVFDTWCVGIAGFGEVETTTRVAQGYVNATLSFGVFTPNYVGDNWGDGISPYEAIKQIVEAERGKFYFRRDGNAVFLSRDIFNSYYTDDATLTDSDFINGVYAYGDDIVNNVTLYYYPRTAETSIVTLWELDEPVTIAAGEERRIRARFNDGVTNTRVAALTTYQPTEADSTLVFSAGQADLVTWEADAQGAEMTFVARDVDTTISTIRIRGTRITAFNKSVARARDDVAIFNSGRGDLILDLPIIDDPNIAQSIANYEVSRRGYARGAFRSITLMNKSQAALDLIHEFTVGYRIHITDQQTGNDASYFIIGEEHTVSDAFTLHTTTWYLEPASNSTFWTVEIAGYSEVEQTTKVAP